MQIFIVHFGFCFETQSIGFFIKFCSKNRIVETAKLDLLWLLILKFGCVSIWPTTETNLFFLVPLKKWNCLVFALKLYGNRLKIKKKTEISWHLPWRCMVKWSFLESETFQPISIEFQGKYRNFSIFWIRVSFFQPIWILFPKSKGFVSNFLNIT